MSFMESDARDFKSSGVATINYVLQELVSDPPASRAFIPSLQLGAVLIYILNSVISRPSPWRGDVSIFDHLFITPSSWYTPSKT